MDTAHPQPDLVGSAHKRPRLGGSKHCFGSRHFSIFNLIPRGDAARTCSSPNSSPLTLLRRYRFDDRERAFAVKKYF